MSDSDKQYEVDVDGFVELGHLERDWFFLEEMRKEKAKLEAAIAKVEAFLQGEMIAAKADGFKIHGVRRVTWRKDATFPAAKYAAANPAVAAAYTIMVPKLDVEALKRDRPEDYKHWRGRSFKFVQQKRGS